MPKVSVIIPVYNVAPYIERCARSLFGQTLDDIEFIFVDDCSSDNSICVVRQVLNDYPSRSGQVKFLANENNLGQSGTRTKGMQNATGDYLIHCDADDWVERRMYELLYSQAIHQKADVVTCDYYLEYVDRVVMNKRGVFSSNPHDVIMDYKTRPFYSCWCHLVKTDIIKDHGIFPIQGLNMWEDMYIGMMTFYYANEIAYVEQPLYHYNKCNESSITLKNPFSDKILEQQIQCVDYLEAFFSDKKDIDFTKTALMLKKMIKDRYLYQTPPNFKKWKACYPEAAGVELAFERTNWKYDIAYLLGRIGILWPLRIYYKYFYVYYP